MPRPSQNAQRFIIIICVVVAAGGFISSQEKEATRDLTRASGFYIGLSDKVGMLHVGRGQKQVEFCCNASRRRVSFLHCPCSLYMPVHFH